MLAGLMPLSNTGADLFRDVNPMFDGRGVLIGILDSGVDAGLPGLRVTTTGEAKVLDARDFSGEGRIALEPVRPTGDAVTIGGTTLTGFSRIAQLGDGPYYGGVLKELPLDKVDANGNGSYSDEFPILVVRTDRGWAVVPDGDGDRSLLDEAPIHDYLVARETFTLSRNNDQHNRGPLTIAVNISEDGSRPVVDLFFDNSAHGSHVAGIAAGYNMFEIEGFHGVAPGAQVIAAKIANNARGGISVSGSMVRAMQYVADFAEDQNLPLILNLSFGVGNEVEGGAVIDSIIDEFILEHPDILFVISAGNEGPGISSIGFPGSAQHALSACALFPGVFSGPRPQGFAIDSDGIADFSSRGGEVAKPDLCAPGIAYSNVPAWNRGGEISGGTSMAAPHLSGLAALLQSASLQQGGAVRGIDLKQSLMASAQRLSTGNVLDMGSGVPNVTAAYAWLSAGHQAGYYDVRALPDGGNRSGRDGAFRRSGFASSADTVQRFEIRSMSGQPAARFLLETDQPWMRAPNELAMRGEPATVAVTYRTDRLRTPGIYVGSVWATPASDTLAGPAFRLTNTIVIPQSLADPFVEGRDLGPGRLRRYFFEIPENSGGFVVEMELRYDTQRGTLHLFEPNGQPFRGGSTADAGGGPGAKARIAVSARDVIPGVYEAVVTAPPRTALSYQLRAGLPRYLVESISDGPSALVSMREDAPEFVQDASVFQRTDSLPVLADSVRVEGRVVGAERSFTVNGQGSAPDSLTVRIPDWAGRVAVQVELPDGLWNEMTDMGVTVYDSVGVEVGEGPLSYPIGRTTIELERWRTGEPLTVELFPAFAIEDPARRWSASVVIGFLARRPLDLELSGVDTTRALSMRPGQSLNVNFMPNPGTWVLPTGFRRIVEVTLTPAGGAPATRRESIN
jgi:subtilisin family serine protease